MGQRVWQAEKSAALSKLQSAAGERAPVQRMTFFRQPFAPILTAASLCLLVVLAVRFLSGGPTIISTVWLASGLCTVVWLRAGRGLGYDLAFGSLAAFSLMTGEILIGNPPDRAAVFMGLSLLESYLAVVLLRRFLPSLDVQCVKGQVKMVGCVFVATLPSAILCAFLLRHGALEGPIAGVRMWWMGHGIGSVMMIAAGLSIKRKLLEEMREPWRVIQFAVLIVAMIAGASFVFSDINVSYAFVLLPLLILTAVRIGVVGTAVALCALTTIAIKGTVAGLGPYHDLPLADRLAMVQMLILLGYAPVLVVAALLKERDNLAERARIGRLKAEQASVAKSRLLANVAHEIKSPVGGIIGIAEMWAAGHLGKVEPQQIEMAQMMVRTGRQIETLSHDLLDVAKAESGAVRIELRATDVAGALEDACAALKLLPEASKLRLEVVHGEGEMKVMADSHRLAQILSNLGSNAAKYGRAGGFVRFRSSRSKSGRIRISVEDGGPGLTQEKQAQLFEPFNRLGLERSSIEGHGIGLALSKRLAELQSGKMGVESISGQGASFWVELPEAE